MDKTRSKIQTSSVTAFVAILAVSAFLGLATATSIAEWWTTGGALSSPESVHRGADLVQQGLIAAVLAYVGVIFLRISREDTPFFKALPRMIKLAAVLLFLAIAVPEWASFPLAGLVGGSPSRVFVDQWIALAFVLAAVVFCLARIFEYGYLVQDENFEII